MIYITYDGGAVESDLSMLTVRPAATNFMTNYLGSGSDAQPHGSTSPGHSFSEFDEQDLSGTLADGLNPLRSGANFYFKDLESWREPNWVDQNIKLGAAELDVLRGIRQCVATNVNRATAIGYRNLPKAPIENYGHKDLGLCARVIISDEMAV